MSRLDENKRQLILESATIYREYALKFGAAQTAASL
jgi:hypothetical protein